MTWLAIKLFLGGALKRTTGAISALLGWIGQYPWQAACLALLLAAGWQTRGKSNALDKLAAQELAHAAYVEQIEAASAANAAAALAQVKAVEAKSAQLARNNANEERALRAELGARAAANADRMRADKYCRRLAAGPAEDNPAPVDPGPGPDAVILSRADYDTLTDNTIRLKAAHAWGQDMLRDGLAKVPEGWPEPAF